MMSKRKAFVNFVKAENIFFMVAVTVLAMAVRLRFFGYISSDYRQFLSGWFELLRQNGGLSAVGINFGDYTPAYYYLLALLTYLPFSGLHLIKALSCAGDVAAAYYVFRIVDRKYGEFWGEIAYAVTLFLPSVILNSAVWAQCDSIYTAALLACICYLMEDRQYLAVTAFSIALAFKLQAVFLAPFLFVLLLKGRIKARCLLIPPLVYVISILPAAVMGRNFWELLTVYFRQSQEYNELTMNLPNLFTWFPADAPESVGRAAVLAAGALVLFTFAYLCAQKFRITDEMLVSLALFYVMLLPYFLPFMHERYWYPADLLSLVFAFYFPEKFYVPVITVMSSVYAYSRFLFGFRFISMKLFSVLMLFNLIWVAIHIIYRIRDGSDWKVMRRGWTD
ncbi:glycosyltransferase 87 family protein [Caproicibacter fermentans]|uniref:DUF2029 domain-containing protein n=2 Tax=Caproicibacter fermentans TaxID=2576756 RepID=A0A7G8T7R4_9FIRM|nr:glycosyltransferase 87 family protein [Caproicibacter fermentans]QNK39655.1 DUF2029 domain-containing protein [Caproicibacter fermentans]